MTNVPPSIFFSHSSHDHPWCEWLAVEARKLGVRTYLAEHDLQAGRSLAEKIKLNIARCDGFVVLLSNHTATSSYVHQEVGYALSEGKLVIPLVQPGVGEAQLAMLNGVEYIEFDFGDPHAGKQSFASEIRRLADQQSKLADVETLIAIGLCVALLVALLGEGGVLGQPDISPPA